MIFPSLEESLTAHGLLTDLSEELRHEDFWSSESLRRNYPPGSIVRVTGDGSLFDARYVAMVLSGFVATYTGLQGIGAMPSTTSSVGSKRGKSSLREPASSEERQLEDMIPLDAPPMPMDAGTNLSPEFLRSMVKIARGMFQPGLHLNMTPTANDTIALTSRLQEGRQFLDSDVEVLFSRYGTDTQPWTLVGAIGHFAPESRPDLSADAGLLSSDGNVHRPRMANFTNSFMSMLGGAGFADAPQYPGFTIVPLAVYRTSGTIGGRELEAHSTT